MIAQARDVEIKLTGRTTTVQNNLISKLQYYLDCVNSVIGIDIPRDLTNYQSGSFSADNLVPLINLCAILNPKFMLENNIFILVENMDKNNQFIEIHDKRIGIAVNQNLVIAGKRVQVHKLMLCMESWLKKFYIEPMAEIRRGIRDQDERRKPRYVPPPNSCCLIL